MKLNGYWYRYAVCPNLDKASAWLLKDRPMSKRLLDMHRETADAVLAAAESYHSAAWGWHGVIRGR